MTFGNVIVTLAKSRAENDVYLHNTGMIMPIVPDWYPVLNQVGKWLLKQR